MDSPKVIQLLEGGKPVKSKKATIFIIIFVILGFVGYWIHDVNTSKTPLVNNPEQGDKNTIGQNGGNGSKEEEDKGEKEQSENSGKEKDTGGNSHSLVKTGVFPGDEAVNFSLKDLQGNDHVLSDYRGKVVILNFWASWCPPCRAEMADLQRFHKKYRDTDVVLLAINIGEEMSERDLNKKIQKDKDIISKYFEQEGLDLTVLLDTFQDVTLNYRVSAIPTTYIIDKEGIISSFYISTLTLEDLEGAIEGLR